MSPSPISRREWLAAVLASLAVVVLASLPYLAAYTTPTPGYQFGGLLFNPYDGNSYLAKMEIGRRGGWLFRLPYSADPGEGAPIFLFYLLLGHLAAWTGASSILIFHLARLAAGVVLLVALFAFTARFFARPGPRWMAWLLIALGSGLGWLAALNGRQTSDLWVAEAIVFLSLFANPHFPLALALMLGLYLWLVPGLADTPPPSGSSSWRKLITIALAAAALAHIQPFSLAILFAVLPATYAVLWAARALDRAGLRPCLPRLAVFVLFSLPWLLFDYWLTQTHPALRAWSTQNLTPSPPAWDYLVTFSPALLLAVFGAWRAARRRSASGLFLVAWLAVNAALLYAPVALQRRLVHGLSVPVGLLAVEGLFGVVAPGPGLRRVALAGLLCALALPSNLLVSLAALQGIQTRHHLLYLRDSEAAALHWLDSDTPPGALVLASPDLGLFIPARTARRVIYGHPFETINAPAEEQAVEGFYNGGESPSEAAAFLASRNIDYVVAGEREAALGGLPDLAALGLTVAFSQDTIVVYQIHP